jgi:hypothetical protein
MLSIIFCFFAYEVGRQIEEKKKAPEKRISEASK